MEACGKGYWGTSSRWISWVLAIASAAGCSDKGPSTASDDSNTTNTTGTPTTHSTTSAIGSSGQNTSSSGTPTTSSLTSTAATSGSGGSGAGGSGDSGAGGSGGSGAGSMGGLAGADSTGDTTGTTGETVEGDVCSFTLNHTTSTAIGTVQIVNWSTDLPNVTEAHIEFGLTGSELALEAPVDLEEPDYRTLLLGMKADKSYSFRIVASSADETCTGPELSFMTGPVPDWVPSITQSGSGPDASKGFIVTTSGLALLTRDRNLPNVFIFDTDGDVVWWTPELIQDATGARMSWDAKTMYYVNAYNASLLSVSMDGMTTREISQVRANHDLTVLPDGGIVTMVNDDENPSIVELKADGSVVTLVPDVATLYAPDFFHPNAIHYHPADNTFTLSDLELSGFVKFTREGELLWQLGGSNPIADSFELDGLEPWSGNHGHHLTADGHFLFFNNSSSDSAELNHSTVFEVLLDENDWTATKTWEYRGDDQNASLQLGDVERLPNGNALITYSNMGQIVEVSPTGEVVQSFVNDMFLPEGSSFPVALFGYASFRTSLYGPPAR